MINRLNGYWFALKNAPDAITMTGYWYHPQNRGEFFEPWSLQGYFNDLRHKVEWPGNVDKDGIPYQSPEGNTKFYFPITVFQKGLGHWDQSLGVGKRRKKEHQHAFLDIADWAVEAQDKQGAWKCWNHGEDTSNSFSAMAQGQAASVLARGYSLTGNREYLSSARKALELMLNPVSEGGTARYNEGGLYLEEYPSGREATVLNGWIFALYGLHDFLVIEEDRQFKTALRETLATLAEKLPGYDTGYWSHYDLSKNMSLPFYHDLHIHQLSALKSTFDSVETVASHYLKQWKEYQGSRLNLFKAMTMKGVEKLLQPPTVRR